MTPRQLLLRASDLIERAQIEIDPDGVMELMIRVADGEVTIYADPGWAERIIAEMTTGEDDVLSWVDGDEC